MKECENKSDNVYSKQKNVTVNVGSNVCGKVEATDKE